MRRRNVTLTNGGSVVADVVLTLSFSADVIVTGRATFRSLADAENPAENLVGIASAASQGAITADQLEARPVMRAGEVLETVPGMIVSQHGERSVSEALRVLRAEWPDVLLADLGLPGEDGYGLIRLVRVVENEKEVRLPAAALTADDREEDRARALHEGFDVPLAKPAEPSAIFETAAVLWKSSVDERNLD